MRIYLDRDTRMAEALIKFEGDNNVTHTSEPGFMHDTMHIEFDTAEDMTVFAIKYPEGLVDNRS